MRRHVAGMLLCGLLCATAAWAGQTPAQQQAEAAELQWLHMVDTGDYSDAWAAEAPYAKELVSHAEFTDALRGVLQPLGAVGTRTLLSATTAHSLPGAPDGDYVVVQYKTHFANKPDAVETVTAMRQPDGAWKVAGYYVR